MFDVVKQWFWYDWILLLFRILASVSVMSAMVDEQAQLTIPIWGMIIWQIISFSIPWLSLLFNYNYYLVSEMVLSGGISLYLSMIFPEAYTTFLIPAFMIAANSAKQSYRWSAPITVLAIPLVINAAAEHHVLLDLIIDIGLAYTIGFAFHLLVVNHRQNGIIRNQNAVLEQYISQIEKVTISEERSRLMKDLHDTLGHSYASIIMGLETLRTELMTSEGQTKLEALLRLARKSMDEGRGFVHQLETPHDRLTLVEALKGLVDEFQFNSDVVVRFRTLGEETTITKLAHTTLYRCLQESLTNAVRHGQATELVVLLQFEEQQTRLEVQDNGLGTAVLQDGFGLRAMKERASNLQGQVSIYSEVGEGTVVTCTLPRQTAQPNEMIRLLVVDDQPFIRESLKTLLEGQRDLLVVGMAEDGVKATEYCEQLQPHVVLMDLDMPNRDGIEATKLIKQNWPAVRVLILTTFQDKEKAKEVLRSGADGYLLKSMEPRELAETIRLVYRGGTIIAPFISNQLFGESEVMLEERGSSITEHDSKVVMESYDLTARELEILQLVAQGLRYKTIASKLYLSDGTVRNYASSAYLKLDVRNREEAVQKVVAAGFLKVN
ncbi:hybrid sensor histidine kinase/response regulator transcription factor [Paenibacillus sp. FSL K6-3182]|uniref:hybrid sensor histidine kinase/response regulator transcription factor n=1 Tax=Paenibacillus sp. FSL K6-3182 TaxID=2921495 RepID=UPI0030D08833